MSHKKRLSSKFANAAPMKRRRSPKIIGSGARSVGCRAQPAPVREPAVQPLAGAPGTGHSILLVDDDAIVRDSLTDVLVAEGYKVIPAENGRQALELASRYAVDLVLLDLNMPVKDGWDTFEQITREHPTVWSAPAPAHYWKSRWTCRRCCARRKNSLLKLPNNDWPV